MNQATKYLFAVTAASVLVACGGGGGGSVAPVAPVPEAPPVVVISSMVTSVPASTYAVGSEEAQAFNVLNAERGRCGFGLLAQNTKIDQASRSHADWLLINNYSGHYESTTVPNGYTGDRPEDRAVAAGYNLWKMSEVQSVERPGNVTGFGLNSLRGLMAAPYHLFGLMSPYKDIGIGIRDASTITPLVSNGLTRAAVYDFGVPAGGDFQLMGASDVSTYPCDGTTGVNYQLNGENPNPVPGRDLAVNPVGHPVLVMVRMGQVLAITSTSMINLTSGLTVALLTPVTSANDPNGVFQGYGNHMGFVLPDAPLAQNTRYQVTVNGTNDGVVFSRTFSFTTGTGD